MIAGLMIPQSFSPDDVIIKYGDHGMTYYILSTGSVKVTVYQDGTDPNDPDIDNKIKFTKNLDKGAGFGELALLYNDRRSATITAQEDCQTYTLDGKLFKAIII